MEHKNYNLFRLMSIAHCCRYLRVMYSHFWNSNIKITIMTRRFIKINKFFITRDTLNIVGLRFERLKISHSHFFAFARIFHFMSINFLISLYIKFLQMWNIRIHTFFSPQREYLVKKHYRAFIFLAISYLITLIFYLGAFYILFNDLMGGNQFAFANFCLACRVRAL